MEQTCQELQPKAVRRSQHKKEKFAGNREQKTPWNSPEKQTATQSRCKKCGLPHPGEIRCPAEGQTCHLCGEVGHFKKVCGQQGTQQKRDLVGRISLQRVSLEESDTIRLRLETNQDNGHVQVTFAWLPDTGSDVNAIVPQQLEQLGLSTEKKLDRDNATVTNANGQHLRNRGTMKVDLATEAGHSCRTKSHVYEGISTPLLSRSTLKALGFLPQQWPRQCAALQSTPRRTI